MVGLFPGGFVLLFGFGFRFVMLLAGLLFVVVGLFLGGFDGCIVGWDFWCACCADGGLGFAVWDVLAVLPVPAIFWVLFS